MNAVVQSIPLNQLHPSPRNVRKTGGMKIDDLAASIRARGLIHNLTVLARPREGKRPGFEVVAGKRRLAALRLLAKRRQLPADAPVDCRVVDSDEAVAASLAENVHREAMHPADQFDAFARLVDEGRSAEDIAAEFGVGTDTVHKRLRLAKVSPRVLALYRADEFNLDQVMAFTLADDHAAQDALIDGDARPSAWEIRRRLTASAVRGDDPRARLVGRKAYLAAGGSIRRDLFGDDATEYYEDAALLQRLATEKLERRAARLRKRLPWVEVIDGAFDYAARAQYVRVPTIRRERDKRTAKQLARLHARLDAARQQAESLEQQDEHDDEVSAQSEEAQARCESLEEAIDELERGLRVPDPDVAALAGAVVALDHRGRIDVVEGLIRPDDKAALRKVERQRQPKALDSDPDAECDPKSVRRDLSTCLTAVAQHALAHNVPLALRALAFQLTLSLRGERHAGHGVGIAADDQADLGPAAAMDGEQAHAARLEWHAAWERTFPTDPQALWAWCREADDHVVLSLLAYCAGRSFNAVLVNGEAQAAMPLLSALRLDMGAHWTPDAAYFARLRKADTLAILAAHGHDGSAFKKLKRDVLAESAAKLLAGSGWLPPTLRIDAE